MPIGTGMGGITAEQGAELTAFALAQLAAQQGAEWCAAHRVQVVCFERATLEAFGRVFVRRETKNGLPGFCIEILLYNRTRGQ